MSSSVYECVGFSCCSMDRITVKEMENFELNICVHQ
jgi:hypothetical protein